MFTQEEIKEKTEMLMKAKELKIALETKKESLVDEIKKKFNVSSTKELSIKIEELQKELKASTESYEAKCVEYEDLESKVDL